MTQGSRCRSPANKENCCTKAIREDANIRYQLVLVLSAPHQVQAAALFQSPVAALDRRRITTLHVLLTSTVAAFDRRCLLFFLFECASIFTRTHRAGH